MIFVSSIYNAKTRFLVVDIETTKPTMKGENGFIFDISFAVFSRKDGIIGKQGYIVEQHQHLVPYYADRLKKYADYQATGEYVIQPFEKIMAIMSAIVKKYNVEYVTAYNLQFDKDTHIEKHCKRLGIESPFKDLKTFCIWQGAAETFGQRKSYKKFTNEHGFISEKGNRQSGAEIMYRYMKNEPEFVEEHTGLADVEIEIELLDRIIRQKKKMSTTYGKGAWRLVQGD
jgi:hypothetical protein